MINFDKLDFEQYDYRDGKFIIYQHNKDILIQDIKKLCQYTQQQDNKIVEIYDVTEKEMVTKYYDGWHCLVYIEAEQDFRRWEAFCSREELEKHVDVYLTFMSNEKNAYQLYNDVVDELEKFAQIGYIFYDRSANNILVNKDISDFRLIDVASIVNITKYYSIQDSKLFISPRHILIGARSDSLEQIYLDTIFSQYIIPHLPKLFKVIDKIPPRIIDCGFLYSNES